MTGSRREAPPANFGTCGVRPLDGARKKKLRRGY